MDNLVWIISTIIIIVILSLIFKELYLKKNMDLDNIIKAKKILLIIGLLCLCILLPLIVLFFYLDKITDSIKKIVS